MDTPQNTLSIESFSCSWLPNSRPSLDSLLGPLDGVVDPDSWAHHDFHFDVPSVSSPRCATFAHADELFSDGILKAVLSDSCNFQPDYSVDYMAFSEETPGRCSLLRRLRKSFTRAIRRCFRGVPPLCIRFTSSRRIARINDIDEMDVEYEGWHCPRGSSSSPSCSSTNSLSVESPIDEAILHCKRSIGRIGGR